LPYLVTEFQDTPNPNALKCVVDHPIAAIETPGIRSYQSAAAAAAAADPFAAAILAVPGVVGVLINPAWVSISKSPDAEWKQVKPALKKVLSAIP